MHKFLYNWLKNIEMEKIKINGRKCAIYFGGGTNGG